MSKKGMSKKGNKCIKPPVKEPIFWNTSFYTWYMFYQNLGESREAIMDRIGGEIDKADISDEMKSWLKQVLGVLPKKTDEELVNAALANVIDVEGKLIAAKASRSIAEGGLEEIQQSIDDGKKRIDEEKKNIQPLLDDISLREEAEIEEVRAKYERERDNVTVQLRRLESDQRGLLAVQNNCQNEIAGIVHNISSLQNKCDKLYQDIDDLENPTIVIIDAGFRPEDIMVMYATYFTSEEEAKINSFLKEIADWIKPKSQEKHEDIKNRPVSEKRGEMIVRADALAEILLRVLDDPKAYYLFRVNKKMQECLKDFFRERRIRSSRTKKEIKGQT